MPNKHVNYSIFQNKFSMLSHFVSSLECIITKPYILSSTFYLQIISNLYISYKSKNTTKSTCTPFTHIYLLLTCFPFALSFASMHVPSLLFLYTHTHTIFFSEPFEGKLQASWPFIPKYFRVLFPINTHILLPNQNTVINISKFNTDTFIKSNMSIPILSGDPVMSSIAYFPNSGSNLESGNAFN